LTLLIFGIDKLKAKKNYYRISEKNLILMCFLGGGIGGLLGMYLFRHKIRKWYFNLLALISLILYIFIWWKFKLLINN
jgi:uncharacterized membrane protein YsdA (DUF1294 family)